MLPTGSSCKLRMLGSATRFCMRSAIRSSTSPSLGSATRICFTSRINIAIVSFWFNLFLSFTYCAVAENSDAYIVILQPGEPYWRGEACCSKMSIIDRNGQIEADRLPNPFGLPLGAVTTYRCSVHCPNAGFDVPLINLDGLLRVAFFGGFRDLDAYVEITGTIWSVMAAFCLLLLLPQRLHPLHPPLLH